MIPMQPPADHPDWPLNELVDRIVASYESEPLTEHLDSIFLPNRAKTIQIIELVRRLVFPGFFDEQRITSDTVRFHVGELLAQTREILFDQVHQALRYQLNREGKGKGDDCPDCDARAAELTTQFLQRIGPVREVLALDVRATFEGDPASANTDETIFCYPGIDAIFIHRIAHELHVLGVPMLPRIMTEYAHNETGIDIHPGATIGRSFFIDHGTGIVIGETSVIGDRVKIYQGVTLGALSLKGGHERWAGRKRHPTIEDDVTIYGGAIILGGEVTIGRGCTIGGSVFITETIPPYHTVWMDVQGMLKKKEKPRREQEKMQQAAEARGKAT
jgi:serine O-acetyltransferase